MAVFGRVTLTGIRRPSYAGRHELRLRDGNRGTRPAPVATVTDIAGALYLSPGTVRNHLSSVMRKLDARNRAEAVRTAEEKGWL
jgi:hypothetical protein